MYWIGVVVLFSLLVGGSLTLLVYYQPVIPFWSVPIVPGALLLIGILYVLLKYRAWSYELQDDGLHLSRGVLIKVNTLVPYVRIQHIDTRRGPIERLLGLSSTVVFTAGSRGADVLIPGLTRERAVQLQDQLREIILKEEERLGDAV